MKLRAPSIFASEGALKECLRRCFDADPVNSANHLEPVRKQAAFEEQYGALVSRDYPNKTTAYILRKALLERRLPIDVNDVQKMARRFIGEGHGHGFAQTIPPKM